MALAITEPYAGSDVAGIKAKAVRDGDSWVLNGKLSFVPGLSWSGLRSTGGVGVEPFLA